MWYKQSLRSQQTSVFRAVSCSGFLAAALTAQNLQEFAVPCLTLDLDFDAECWVKILERAAANRERERERAKVPRADESRSGLRRSVPAAVVQSSSTGNSQKAEPTETRKRPPAEAAGKAPSATVDPTAAKGVLVPEDQLAEFLKWKDQ